MLHTFHGSPLSIVKGDEVEDMEGRKFTATGDAYKDENLQCYAVKGNGTRHGKQGEFWFHFEYGTSVKITTEDEAYNV